MSLRNANFQAKANIKKAAQEEVITVIFNFLGFFYYLGFWQDLAVIEIFHALRSSYRLNLELVLLVT
jgi:hypothetical protein